MSQLYLLCWAEGINLRNIYGMTEKDRGSEWGITKLAAVNRPSSTVYKCVLIKINNLYNYGTSKYCTFYYLYNSQKWLSLGESRQITISHVSVIFLSSVLKVSMKTVISIKSTIYIRLAFTSSQFIAYMNIFSNLLSVQHHSNLKTINYSYLHNVVKNN